MESVTIILSRSLLYSSSIFLKAKLVAYPFRVLLVWRVSAGSDPNFAIQWVAILLPIPGAVLTEVFRGFP
jgi:hypothetical protein